MQPVPITTDVVSLNPAHGEVCSIQHYVIKFVSDVRQVCGFLQVFLFPPPIKLTATIYCKPTYFRGYYVPRFSASRQFRGDLISW
jgi:hypothetical protein